MNNRGTYGKGAKGKADRLFSLVIRSVGFCRACGSTRNLQCAHIIARRYNATRTDERNALCLCAGCHIRFTDHPVEFAKFVEQTIGLPAYEELFEKSQSGVKANDAFWQSECARLSALLKEAS